MLRQYLPRSADLGKFSQAALVRKAGVMGIVICGGVVRPGDRIAVVLPVGPHRELERV